MASIPLQTIVDLHALSDRNRGRWVKRKDYEAYTYPDGKFKLTHYGTVIFTIDPSTRKYTVDGWSASDRDAVNSMLHIYGIREKSTAKGGSVKLSTGAAEASYNKKRPATKKATPAKASGNGKRNPTTSKEMLSELGYDLVKEKVSGMDPVMKYIESVIIGKRRSDGRYAVWYGIDWTKHPNPRDKKNGFTVGQGEYDLTRYEADAAFERRIERSKRYKWDPVGSANTRKAPTKSPTKKRTTSGATAPTDFGRCRYSKQTLGQVRIQAAYYDAEASRSKGRPVYNVLLYGDDWGVDYDPRTGLYERMVGRNEREAAEVKRRGQLVFRPGIPAPATHVDEVGDIRMRDIAKAMVADRMVGSANGKPGFNDLPRPDPSEYASAPYAQRTSGGHRILKVYYDAWESRWYDRPVYDVVATRQDLGGLIWGRDYDPMSGLWSGGDYHQTEEQITNHASGHRLIASYNVSRSACAGCAGKPKAKPKQSSQCMKRKTAKAPAKPKSTAGKSTASKQRKPAQPRKANGQFAKKPKTKGGRR